MTGIVGEKHQGTLEIIETKNFHAGTKPVVKFLQQHGAKQTRVNGSQILIENVKHDDLKLLLHKFLHHEHFDKYKVHSQSGLIEIVPSSSSEPTKDKQKDTKGRGPTSSETMPYLFPGR